jgi:hypothetical protein
MILYYILIVLGAVITVFAVMNLLKIKKIEKNLNNYIFALTYERNYYVGAILFSLALLAVASFQVISYLNDISVFSILFFFFSMFLLSLSHLIYHNAVIKKIDNIEEYFKDFGIDLNSKCEKLMLKYIYSKEKNEEKVKEIFKKNKHLCEEKE